MRLNFEADLIGSSQSASQVSVHMVMEVQLQACCNPSASRAAPRRPGCPLPRSTRTQKPPLSICHGAMPSEQRSRPDEALVNLERYIDQGPSQARRYAKCQERTAR